MHVLNSCQGEDWSNLEKSLGTKIYSVFEDEFEGVDMAGGDNTIFNSIEQNREKGNTIATIFDTGQITA